MLTCLALLTGIVFTIVGGMLVIFIACWVYIAFHPEMADARPPNSERV